MSNIRNLVCCCSFSSYCLFPQLLGSISAFWIPPLLSAEHCGRRVWGYAGTRRTPMAVRVVVGRGVCCLHFRVVLRCVELRYVALR